MDDNRFANAIEELKAAIDRSVGGGDLEIKLVISIMDEMTKREILVAMAEGKVFALETAGSQCQVGEDVCLAVEKFTTDFGV